MLDRIRSRSGLAPQRHMTRREKEHRQRQLLLIFTGAAAILVVLALAIGAFYQYFWFPRQSVATVNGTEIRRSDYMKVRKYLIQQEVAQLSQQIQVAQADQRPQMQTRLGMLQQEFADLEDGDVNLDPQTVADMIDDQIVLANIDDLGITITDEDIDQFVLEIFSPIPLGDVTPTPTVEPTAAAWATATIDAFTDQMTATAEAQQTEAAQPTEEPEGTPDPDVTPDADASPTAEAPAATPTAAAEEETPDDAAEPTGEAEPTEEAEPTPTLPPTETPSVDEARATSEASFDLLERNYLETSDMSRGDFERLIVRPALARQRVQEHLAANVSAYADQARLSHILVATREAAQELLDTRLQEEDFADVAAEVSIDTQSAQNGGDLGWAPATAYVPEFAEAAFALEPGQMSEPVQTQFGWHIILMTEFEEDRPLTIQALNQVKSAAFQRWLEDLRDQADIETDVTLPSEQPIIPPIG